MNYHFVVKQDPTKPEQTTEAISGNIQQTQSKTTFEGKLFKQQAKGEAEKLVKNKDNNASKTKNKKPKEDKKEEAELKPKEEDNRAEVNFTMARAVISGPL